MVKDRLLNAIDKAAKRVARPLIALLIAACASGCALDMVEKEEPLTQAERLDLAYIYETDGKLPLALNEYDKASEARPSEAKAWFGRGNTLLKLKRFSEAEDSFKKALAADPMNPIYLNNLGWAMMENRRYAEAAGAVIEALRIDRERAYIYLDTLGEICMRKGEYAEAEDNLLESIRRLPEDAKDAKRRIYLHIIELYGKTGQKEKLKAAKETLDLFVQ